MSSLLFYFYQLIFSNQYYIIYSTKLSLVVKRLNIQFKKGVLELCVLVLLNKKDCYGYELVQKISDQIDISEGTVYPLLRRLNKEGYFTTYLKESTEGPPRKYYRLTDKGKAYLNELLNEWDAFTKGVNELIKEGAKGE